MEPNPPAVHRGPIEIAPDTFLVRSTAGEGHAPVFVTINSMVIRGEEPTIVDTGGRDNRANWIDDVFSLVDPEDVRWIVISHDDVDHTGNLAVALDMCPNATFVSSWFINERMSVELAVPPDRMRWLVAGDRLRLPDRTLELVRPPIFDSPTTRGVYDTTTGVYWAGDAFATPLAQHTDDVADLDLDFWAEGLTLFAQAVSPWLALVDHDRFAATVDRIAALRPRVIAGCHTPVITGDRIALALDVTRQVPALPELPLPGQEVLDEMLAAITAAPAA